MSGRASPTSPPPRRPRKKYRSAVVKYDRAGNKLGEYPSAFAAARAHGIPTINLTRVAHHEPTHHTAGGFVWVWADDPIHLFREYRSARDIAARNKLVEFHFPLVRTIASVIHKRMPREVRFDDLVSAGVVGLIEAISNFDPDRAIKFPTFASLHVRGRMIDWLRECDHVPRLTRERVERLEAVADQFRSETGRSPSDEELRARLNVSAEQWEVLAREKIVGKVSLGARVDDGEGESLGSTIDGNVPPPECDPSATSLRDMLLLHFPLTDALLVRLYYVDGCTMKEIAGALGGLSESRVSQRHTRIVKTLRARFTREQLSTLIGGEAA